MSLGNEWFSEIYPDHGSAFSMKIEKKLHEEQTPFQRIEIYETAYFGTLMVIDGCVMVTDRDNFLYHEMMSHMALFTHPQPIKVVIIGGGDCGTLQEVLKHASVEEAWLVEIDERVTRLAEKYFPELCTANDDARARFHFDDGIKFIADAEPGSIDVIIVDSTDPVGPAKGLFSEPFYRSCLKALSPAGIIVQQSESPLFHMQIIKEMREEMRKAGFTKFQTLFFPQCAYPSGWWSATMASKQQALNQFREDAVAKKKFKTVYYNAAIHRSALAAPEFVKEQLSLSE